MIKPFIKRGTNEPSTTQRATLGGRIYVDERSEDANDLTFAASNGFPTSALFANTGSLCMVYARKTVAGTHAKGICLAKAADGGYDACILPTLSAPCRRLAGVITRSLDVNEYDFLVVKGEFYVVSGGAFSAGDPLKADAAGKAIVIAGGSDEEAVFANASAAAAGADLTVQAYIDII